MDREEDEKEDEEEEEKEDEEEEEKEENEEEERGSLTLHCDYFTRLQRSDIKPHTEG